MDDTFVGRLKCGGSIKIFVVKVEILRRCNLRCRKCFSWRSTEQEDMPRERLLRIIDECSKHGCHVLNLIGGEPTLYDALPEIVAYAGERDIKCGITSNGQLIDEAYAMRLHKAKLKSIWISLDSHQEELHDYIVGAPGAWRRSVDAIRILLQHIRYVGVNSVLASFNYRDIIDLLRFVHGLGVRHLSFMPYEDTGDRKNNSLFRLQPQHIDELNSTLIPRSLEVSKELAVETNLSRIFRFGGGGAGIMSRTNDLQLRTPCFLPFYRVEIDRKGNAFPCCEMIEEKFRMGNILESGLDAIIACKKYCKFRRGLIPPLKHPRCRSCWITIDDNLEIMQELAGYDAGSLLRRMLDRTECAGAGTGIVEKG
ncbi:MAG: radical SAM protein [bacterium]